MHINGHTAAYTAGKAAVRDEGQRNFAAPWVIKAGAVSNIQVGCSVCKVGCELHRRQSYKAKSEGIVVNKMLSLLMRDYSNALTAASMLLPRPLPPPAR